MRYALSMLRCSSLTFGMTVVVFGPAALAHWTVTNLHPAGATYSRALGVSGFQQVGHATIDGQPHASLWTGSAQSWIDLNPPGAVRSECWDVDRGRQVGSVQIETGMNRAALWSSTRDSYVDLHPSTSEVSVAWGIDGETQAGSAGPRQIGLRAVTWTGTAQSAVDHHPPAVPPPHLVRQSEFFGIRDGHAVGYWFGMSPRPFRGTMLTEAGLLDITPDWGADPGSVSCNVDSSSRGQHVGYAEVLFGPRKAILWTGLSATPADLTPPNRTSAWAQGVWRGQQVGYVNASNGAPRAALWNGSAESWIDLHTFVPPNYTSSTARAIWSDRFQTFAAGWATNASTGRTEALMWSRASCWADLTHNEVVDDEDFSPFAIAYDDLICPAKLCPADLNDDGVVDDADFQLFVAAYDALLCP